LLPLVVRALDDAEVAVEDIALRRPTLDEVFLALTGSSSSFTDHNPTSPKEGAAA
jgi:ABC-2 type transport system ATP-binding protein